VATNSLPLATSHAEAGAPRYCCSEQNGTLVEFTSTAVYGAAAIVFDAPGLFNTMVCARQSIA